MKYLVLLRGVNVGGKGKVPMAELRMLLEEYGFSGVSTYIASGNVMLASDKNAQDIGEAVEKILQEDFNLSHVTNKVLVLTEKQLQDVINNKPRGFGDEPDKYHSDAIFLMDISTAEAMPVFNPREGVDKVWPGDGVVYSQRLSALRTKSRLNSIVGTPVYHSMTIRSWNTTTKLLSLLQDMKVNE